MTELQDIRDFLGRKRVAFVGVSRNPKDFTRTLFREFRQRGFDAVPVNPAVTEMDGVPCCASLGDVNPPPETALLLTSPAVTEQAVRDCAAAGVGMVWMYRATGAGAVSQEAVRFCQSHGIRVVAGECPFMFLPDAGWFHRFHGFCKKITGKYPR